MSRESFADDLPVRENEVRQRKGCKSSGGGRRRLVDETTFGPTHFTLRSIS